MKKYKLERHYITTKKIELAKHLAETVSFQETPSTIDDKVLKATVNAITKGSIPMLMPQASIDMLSSIYHYIENGSERRINGQLYTFSKAKMLWERSSIVDFTAHIKDYFTAMGEIAHLEKDLVRELGCDLMLANGGKLCNFTADALLQKASFKETMSACTSMDSATQRYRFFKGVDEYDGQGIKQRYVLDMNQDKFELSLADDEFACKNYISRMMPEPIVTDDEDEPTLWTSLLKLYMMNDATKYDYLCKVLGYLMSPTNKDQVFLYLYGTKGKNGKSTVLHVLQRVLGEYATLLQGNMLTAKEYGSTAQFDEALATAAGKSVVLFDEIKEQKMIDSELIKNLANCGYTVNISPKYEKTRAVTLTGTPVIASNNLLNLSGTNVDPIIRRCIIINFDYYIDNEDATIITRLDEELPKIQMWLFKQYFKLMDYMKQNGIKNIKDVPKPEDFANTLAQYKTDGDHMQTFYLDCFVKTDNPDDMIKFTDAYRMYEVWCKSVGKKNPLSNQGNNSFSSSFRRFIPMDERNRGITWKRTNECKVFIGFARSKHFTEDIAPFYHIDK